MEIPSPPTKKPHILTETREIIKSNRRVFNSLTALFLLPTAIAVAVFNSYRQSLPPSVQTAALAILSVGSLIVTPCALGSISYTTLLARNGEKISVSAAVKSLSSSFLPLLVTLVVSQSVITLVTVAYALIVFFAIHGSSIYVIVISTVFFYVALTYMQVNWALAYPVAVFESARGFAALQRSRALVRGHGWLVLYLSLVFMVMYGVVFFFIATISGSSEIGDRSRDGDWWSTLFLDVCQILSSAYLLALVQESCIVANTVLYAFCKGDGFSGEYVSLPANDRKVDSLA